MQINCLKHEWVKQAVWFGLVEIDIEDMLPLALDIPASCNKDSQSYLNNQIEFSPDNLFQSQTWNFIESNYSYQSYSFCQPQICLRTEFDEPLSTFIFPSYFNL